MQSNNRNKNNNVQQDSETFDDFDTLGDFDTMSTFDGNDTEDNEDTNYEDVERQFNQDGDYDNIDDGFFTTSEPTKDDESTDTERKNIERQFNQDGNYDDIDDDLFTASEPPVSKNETDDSLDDTSLDVYDTGLYFTSKKDFDKFNNDYNRIYSHLQQLFNQLGDAQINQKMNLRQRSDLVDKIDATRSELFEAFENLHDAIRENVSEIKRFKVETSIDPSVFDKYINPNQTQSEKLDVDDLSFQDYSSKRRRIKQQKD